MNENDDITLIEIENPFDQTIKERRKVPFVDGQPVLGYLAGPRSTNYVASVNGEVLEDAELARRTPVPGDFIVICPKLRGGGGQDEDKMIMRMVVMIAIAVVAPGVGAAMAGTLGMGEAAWTVAFTMMASMAVSAIATADSQKRLADDTPSYGADGAKNTADEGVPVPVVYGQFRYAGNIIGNYTRTDTEDNQTLYMLINCGEGPTGIPTGWEVDEQAADSVKAEIKYLDGSDEQNLAAKIPYFNETITPFSENFRLTEDWHVYTTQGEVDRVRLDFTAPAGLYLTSKSTGNEFAVEVELAVQYRLAGSSDPWVDLPTEQTFPTLDPVDTWLDIKHQVGSTWDGDGIYELSPYTPDGTEVLSTFTTRTEFGGDGSGSGGPGGGGGGDGGGDGGGE